MSGNRWRERGISVLTLTAVSAAVMMAAVTTVAAREPGGQVALPVEKPAPQEMRMYIPEEDAAEERVSEEPKLPFAPVPESEAVADTYFNSIVFLGDSRTEGLFLYTSLPKEQCYTAVGANVASVVQQADWETAEGEKISLADAVAQAECDKIYVMLGINELGWPDHFYREYAQELVERLKADHPESTLVLQTVFPVSARQEALGTYVNNERITLFNSILWEIAEKNDCCLIDVAEIFRNEEGVLPPELTDDGVHLNIAGCRIWLDYLRTHSV